MTVGPATDLLRDYLARSDNIVTTGWLAAVLQSVALEALAVPTCILHGVNEVPEGTPGAKRVQGVHGPIWIMESSWRQEPDCDRANRAIALSVVVLHNIMFGQPKLDAQTQKRMRELADVS